MSATKQFVEVRVQVKTQRGATAVIKRHKRATIVEDPQAFDLLVRVLALKCRLKAIDFYGTGEGKLKVQIQRPGESRVRVL